MAKDATDDLARQGRATWPPQWQSSASDLYERGKQVVDNARSNVGAAVDEGKSTAEQTATTSRSRPGAAILDIKVHVREAPGDCYVVELSGEIDVYTSPKVKDAISELIDRGVYHLVINLEKVRYIDSTGLGRADRRAQARARTRRFGEPRLHQPADQEDLRHHRPGEDLRHLRRRRAAMKALGVNQPSSTQRAAGLVELRIPCRAEWVAVARLAVAAVANRLHFSIEEIEDVKLAVAEACTAVIQHEKHGECDRTRVRSASPTRCEFACTTAGGIAGIRNALGDGLRRSARGRAGRVS